MLKNKRILLIIILAVALFLIPNICNSAETYKTTTNINGININWEYELNESNKIIGLKCTNTSELPNEFSIPKTIDGKEIVSLRFEAFKNATNLKKVTIPNTLRQGSISPIFKGCTNLTTIIFEEGLTVIPSCLCSGTNIKEIKIPNSVKTIEHNAFSNCSNLTKVDLGNIETISFSAFENCTSLKSITIPNTLKNGPVVEPVFKGCTNLTSITFEEGITIIPADLCSSTNIKEIKIPNSVKTIEHNAFSNCSNLTKVDLGNIETISFSAFENCTSLKSITIPNTLKNGPVVEPVFKGCTNLTSITFEEGITIIPALLCANTNITEITIPNTVTEIGHDAFADCSNLKEVIVLGEVKEIGWYVLYSDKDTVFTNHSDSLVIYCKEGSKIAKYAADTKIKYKYILEQETPIIPEQPDKNNNKQPTTDSTQESGNIGDADEGTLIPEKNNKEEKDDTIIKADKLPQTGIAILALIAISLLTVAIISKVKCNQYRDI